MRLEQLRGLDPDRLDLLQVRAFPLEAPWVRVRLRVPPWVRVRLREEEEEWALPWGLQEMAWGHWVNLEQEMVRNREGKGTRVLEEGAGPGVGRGRKERGMVVGRGALGAGTGPTPGAGTGPAPGAGTGPAPGAGQDQRLGQEQDQRRGGNRTSAGSGNRTSAGGGNRASAWGGSRTSAGAGSRAISWFDLGGER